MLRAMVREKNGTVKSRTPFDQRLAFGSANCTAARIPMTRYLSCEIR